MKSHFSHNLFFRFQGSLVWKSFKDDVIKDGVLYLGQNDECHIETVSSANSDIIINLSSKLFSGSIAFDKQTERFKSAKLRLGKSDFNEMRRYAQEKLPSYYYSQKDSLEKYLMGKAESYNWSKWLFGIITVLSTSPSGPTIIFVESPFFNRYHSVYFRWARGTWEPTYRNIDV